MIWVGWCLYIMYHTHVPLARDYFALGNVVHPHIELLMYLFMGLIG